MLTKQEIQLRHANYYVNLLFRLDELYKENTFQTLQQLDINWAQIQLGQKWAAHYVLTSEAARALTIAYTRMGSLLLETRLTPSEERAWSLAGLEAARQMQDQRLESVYLNDLAASEQKLGNYREATHNYNEALRLAQAANDLTQQSQAMGGLGRLYSTIEKLQEAISLFHTAIDLAKQDKSLLLQTRLMSELGLVLVKQERYDDAIPLLEEALRMSEGIGDRYRQTNELGSLGTAYVHSGQYERGIEILKKSLELAEATGDRPEQARSLSSLVQ